MWKWSELKNLLKGNGQRDPAELGAIMWPVVYPAYENDKYNPKDPHVTVVMFENINDPNKGFSKEDVFWAVERAIGGNSQLRTKVTGVEYFGENNDWPVLRVDHMFFDMYHEEIKKLLDMQGIEYDKRFPEYKPHVSTTPEAAAEGIYPAVLWTRPVEVWWGKVHYKFDWDKKVWTI